MQPPGVGSVIKTGWTMPQQRQEHTRVNGQIDTFDPNWVPDIAAARNSAFTPDASDCIYTIDGPDVFQQEGWVTTIQRSMDFYSQGCWRGNPFPDSCFWYFEANWDLNGNPHQGHGEYPPLGTGSCPGGLIP